MKLSVIVPAFNEAESIFDNLGELKSELQDFGLDYEIVVSNDGSVDETYSEIMRFIAENKNTKAVHWPSNLGKGHAIMKGFEQTTGDVVTFLDADLDIPPRQIGKLLHYMKKEDADLVIGSKAHPLSSLNYSSIRRFLSIGFRILVRILFQLPVRDTQAGIKMIRSSALKTILHKVVIREYAFDLELLVCAYKNHFKIVEAPIEINPRRKFGRISVKDIIKILRDTTKIIYRLHIARYYDLP